MFKYLEHFVVALLLVFNIYLGSIFYNNIYSQYMSTAGLYSIVIFDNNCGSRYEFHTDHLGYKKYKDRIEFTDIDTESKSTIYFTAEGTSESYAQCIIVTKMD